MNQIYKINKIADIKKYRQKIPISLVDREDAYVWQYPMNLPVILVTIKDIQIKSKYHVHYFRSDKPFKKVRLRVEDFFLFLLNYDLIAARAILDRNHNLFNWPYLNKRLKEEHLLEKAAQIFIQDYLKSVKPVSNALPKNALIRASSKNKFKLATI